MAPMLLDNLAWPSLASGAPASFGTSGLAMLGLAVIGLTLVMRSTYRRLRKRDAERPADARSLYASAGQDRHATRDAEQVMIELDRLARQIHGQIDTRFAKLEKTIRDADERIQTLAGLLQQEGARPPRHNVDITLPEEGPNVIPDVARSGAAFARSGSPVGADSPEHANEAADARKKEIQRLAAAGLSVADIAHQVDMLTGEVELILALDKARQAALIGGSPPRTPD